MRKKVKKVRNKYLEDFPIYKRIATSKKNGDVYEVTKVLTYDEKLQHFCPASGPDSFADSIDRVPDVSLIDRFEAVALLDSAIANIEFVKPNEDEK